MKRMQKFHLFLALAVGSIATSSIELNAETLIEECSKDLMTYFPESLVNETLKKFSLPQEQWTSIVRELSEKESNIIKKVEEKAEKMSPNPLKDPSQQKAAIKIFKEALLEAFTETMQKHGIQDNKQIQNMLNDIQQQKARKFASCIEKQRAKSKSE